ncbi:hypothetical protein KIPB_006652 [Kipferlia bialata]|uniref:Uncharacterized protein n=1 Tax=Kipferlia bialata TaxID=797122 RepID=A0A9K3CYV0_9EUKA|nr:hypothetical protein KIPB_006652 [Kipferlia bialata]|eukprot:g6652.t1
MQERKARHLEELKEEARARDPVPRPASAGANPTRASERLYSLSKVTPSNRSAGYESEEPTFTPSLAPGTVALTRDRRTRTVDELVSNARSVETRRQARERVEQEEAAECTFKPVLSSKGSRSRPSLPFHAPGGLTSEIETQRMNHTRKVAMLKREQQNQSARQCTFSPAVLDRPPQHRQSPSTRPGSAGVKGLGDYVDRQRRARHLREEKTRRLEQSGRGAPITGPYTVAQEFTLSQDPREAERMERVRRDREQTLMGECTFRPNITSRAKVTNLVGSVLDLSQGQ